MEKQQSMKIDAWIKEAAEASKLAEDLESRIENAENHEELLQKLTDGAHSKLLQLGVKIDRLETLLRNPPAKPLLTDKDLVFRWRLLSNLQLRTRTIAHSFYAAPSTSRPRIRPPSDHKANYEADHTRTTLSKEDLGLLIPLVSEDGFKSQMQLKVAQSKSWLWKACWVIFMLLGAAVLGVLLLIVCAII